MLSGKSIILTNSIIFSNTINYQLLRDIFKIGSDNEIKGLSYS